MAESFNELSELARRSLRAVLQSQIHVIHHMLLAGPRLAGQVPRLQAILRDLGFDGWQKTDQEEAEFMVDPMETLT